MELYFISPQNIFADKTIKPSSKLVLICISNICKMSPTKTCYASQETIGEKCNLDRKTVNKAFRELKEQGFIEVIKAQNHQPCHIKVNEKKFPIIPSNKKQPANDTDNQGSFVPYFEYINSPAWQKRKKAFKQKMGFKCQICGSNKCLVVHHVSYLNLGQEKDEDLMLLCENCHKKEHQKQ